MLGQIRIALTFAVICGGALCSTAQAQSIQGPDMGRLLATGGITSVEGTGGGGLVPWALITGYGTRDSYGANVSATNLDTQDYSLKTYGIAVGIADRIEFSLAQQDFRGTDAALAGIGIKQDIFGIKVKVAGDALYEQDRFIPQIAIGAQYKRNNGITGPLAAAGITNVTQLGAADDSGIDYYVAATKILLDQSLLLNATVRFTKANQFGLLGFGGPGGNSYEPVLEGSVAYLVNRNVVLGAEYRQKRGNLDPVAVDKEDDAYDVFLAYFPTKNISLTAAYVVLGDITRFNPTNQKGLYLSIQAGF